MTTPKIILTCGEPAGIGPDIVLAVAAKTWPAHLICVSDRDMLGARARQLGLDITLTDYTSTDSPRAHVAGELPLVHIPLHSPVIPGCLNPDNAGHVLATLDYAVELCRVGECQGMVTAPVQKSVINDAGFAFSGHTEFLADATDTEQVVMMLTAGDLRVALATTHLPLSEVPRAITKERLERIITILHQDLQAKFGIEDPRITVLGLNPHAGEGGHLGHEEIEVITPALELLKAKGLALVGPLPADTAFNPEVRENTDAYLAMYHDQGLPVLKYAGFGDAVNITLGLPILRTSVDHGTALSLAGTGNASASSLEAALSLAIDSTLRTMQ
ncbi:4-hydroxythreonine-4-phosphate dehydrogenase [Luminiphilus syltensis NOR5-1B]|uniref:4-hydroxythreonine-4-phosphate dehydrogenase n=1 Tax=Luminiphilus syltensis NOR5-1B TaxID=565045 RepID=B8KVY4_9GAMM|nr:4-hydroxythreonine-4-phosphate dehydrogenase PdxA [Luminiphilus syltensis]EED35438.1 4-hydroxythreonine-4-phosphate dehydrogenase [Luminiphilus syltensis NOR5-1B]